MGTVFIAARERSPNIVAKHSTAPPRTSAEHQEVLSQGCGGNSVNLFFFGNCIDFFLTQASHRDAVVERNHWSPPRT
jgi:hypothetical protein